MDLAGRISDVIANNDRTLGLKVGVALRWLETGEEALIDADLPVPLASVVKVPVLVEAFRQIESGCLRLDDRWSLSARLKTVGSGILRALDDGLAPTVRDVLTLMIVVSDNSATDMVLDRVGVASVHARMRELGLDNIHVRHTIREIFDDMLPSGDPSQDAEELARWEAERGVRRDGFSYSRGPDNNAGTPRDVMCLMALIFEGKAAGGPSCRAMLDILARQHYNERFPRYLPAGTRVAHKTGSFAGVSNDAGLLYVSDNAHVAFAVLCTWDQESVRGNRIAEVEATTALWDTIGRIGLAAFEHVREAGSSHDPRGRD